ncbi:MAG: aminoacyl-tRNA deacylase [Actinobacteria bacterium]|nr:aminoacyl-tRNA deacylase [Actinomycetota bacterium]
MAIPSSNGRAATGAILALQAAGVAFTVHHFEHVSNNRGHGWVAATALELPPERVFKTLVVNLTVNLTGSAGSTGGQGIEQVVAIVPVSGQLSLRELAVALGGKRAEMCSVAVAERVTGYVTGGISPFGQKKRLRTAIDDSCVLFETVFVSGGRRGLDIELAPDALVDLLSAVVAPIATS